MEEFTKWSVTTTEIFLDGPIYVTTKTPNYRIREGLNYSSSKDLERISPGISKKVRNETVIKKIENEKSGKKNIHDVLNERVNKRESDNKKEQMNISPQKNTILIRKKIEIKEEPVFRDSIPYETVDLSDSMFLYAINSGMNVNETKKWQEELVNKAINTPRKLAFGNEMRYPYNKMRIRFDNEIVRNPYFFDSEDGLRVHNKMVPGSIFFVPMYEQIFRENDMKNISSIISEDLFIDEYVPLMTLNACMSLILLIRQLSLKGGSIPLKEMLNIATNLISFVVGYRSHSGLYHSGSPSNKETLDHILQSVRNIVFVPVILGKYLHIVDISHSETLINIKNIFKSTVKKSVSFSEGAATKFQKNGEYLLPHEIEEQMMPITIKISKSEHIMDKILSTDKNDKQSNEFKRTSMNIFSLVSASRYNVLPFIGHKGLGFNGVFARVKNIGTVCLLHREHLGGSISPDVFIRYIDFGSLGSMRVDQREFVGLPQLSVGKKKNVVQNHVFLCSLKKPNAPLLSSYHIPHGIVNNWFNETSLNMITVNHNFMVDSTQSMSSSETSPSFFHEGSSSPYFKKKGRKSELRRKIRFNELYFVPERKGKKQQGVTFSVWQPFLSTSKKGNKRIMSISSSMEYKEYTKNILNGTSISLTNAHIIGDLMITRQESYPDVFVRAQTDSSKSIFVLNEEEEQQQYKHIVHNIPQMPKTRGKGTKMRTNQYNVITILGEMEPSIVSTLRATVRQLLFRSRLDRGDNDGIYMDSYIMPLITDVLMLENKSAFNAPTPLHKRFARFKNVQKRRSEEKLRSRSKRKDKGKEKEEEETLLTEKITGSVSISNEDDTDVVQSIIARSFINTIEGWLHPKRVNTLKHSLFSNEDETTRNSSPIESPLRPVTVLQRIIIACDYVISSNIPNNTYGTNNTFIPSNLPSIGYSVPDIVSSIVSDNTISSLIRNNLRASDFSMNRLHENIESILHSNVFRYVTTTGVYSTIAHILKLWSKYAIKLDAVDLSVFTRSSALSGRMERGIGKWGTLQHSIELSSENKIRDSASDTFEDPHIFQNEEHIKNLYYFGGKNEWMPARKILEEIFNEYQKEFMSLVDAHWELGSSSICNRHLNGSESYTYSSCRMWHIEARAQLEILLDTMIIYFSFRRDSIFGQTFTMFNWANGDTPMYGIFDRISTRRNEKTKSEVILPISAFRSLGISKNKSLLFRTFYSADETSLHKNVTNTGESFSVKTYYKHLNEKYGDTKTVSRSVDKKNSIRNVFDIMSTWAYSTHLRQLFYEKGAIEKRTLLFDPDSSFSKNPTLNTSWNKTYFGKTRFKESFTLESFNPNESYNIVTHELFSLRTKDIYNTKIPKIEKDTIKSLRNMMNNRSVNESKLTIRPSGDPIKGNGLFCDDVRGIPPGAFIVPFEGWITKKSTYNKYSRMDKNFSKTYDPKDVVSFGLSSDTGEELFIVSSSGIPGQDKYKGSIDSVPTSFNHISRFINTACSKEIANCSLVRWIVNGEQQLWIINPFTRTIQRGEELLILYDNSDPINYFKDVGLYSRSFGFIYPPDKIRNEMGEILMEIDNYNITGTKHDVSMILKSGFKNGSDVAASIFSIQKHQRSSSQILLVDDEDDEMFSRLLSQEESIISIEEGIEVEEEEGTIKDIFNKGSRSRDAKYSLGFQIKLIRKKARESIINSTRKKLVWFPFIGAYKNISSKSNDEYTWATPLRYIQSREESLFVDIKINSRSVDIHEEDLTINDFVYTGIPAPRTVEETYRKYVIPTLKRLAKTYGDETIFYLKPDIKNQSYENIISLEMERSKPINEYDTSLSSFIKSKGLQPNSVLENSVIEGEITFSLFMRRRNKFYGAILLLLKQRSNGEIDEGRFKATYVILINILKDMSTENLLTVSTKSSQDVLDNISSIQNEENEEKKITTKSKRTKYKTLDWLIFSESSKRIILREYASDAGFSIYNSSSMISSHYDNIQTNFKDTHLMSIDEYYDEERISMHDKIFRKYVERNRFGQLNEKTMVLFSGDNERGLGLYSTKEILPGEPIIPFLGEILTATEMQRKRDEYVSKYEHTLHKYQEYIDIKSEDLFVEKTPGDNQLLPNELRESTLSAKKEEFNIFKRDIALKLAEENFIDHPDPMFYSSEYIELEISGRTLYVYNAHKGSDARFANTSRYYANCSLEIINVPIVELQTFHDWAREMYENGIRYIPLPFLVNNTANVIKRGEEILWDYVGHNIHGGDFGYEKPPWKIDIETFYPLRDNLSTIEIIPLSIVSTIEKEEEQEIDIDDINDNNDSEETEEEESEENEFEFETEESIKRELEKEDTSFPFGNNVIGIQWSQETTIMAPISLQGSTLGSTGRVNPTSVELLRSFLRVTREMPLGKMTPLTKSGNILNDTMDRMEDSLYDRNQILLIRNAVNQVQFKSEALSDSISQAWCSSISVFYGLNIRSFPNTAHRNKWLASNLGGIPSETKYTISEMYHSGHGVHSTLATERNNAANLASFVSMLNHAIDDLQQRLFYTIEYKSFESVLHSSNIESLIISETMRALLFIFISSWRSTCAIITNVSEPFKTQMKKLKLVASMLGFYKIAHKQFEKTETYVEQNIDESITPSSVSVSFKEKRNTLNMRLYIHKLDNVMIGNEDLRHQSLFINTFFGGKWQDISPSSHEIVPPIDHIRSIDKWRARKNRHLDDMMIQKEGHVLSKILTYLQLNSLNIITEPIKESRRIKNRTMTRIETITSNIDSIIVPIEKATVSFKREWTSTKQISAETDISKRTEKRTKRNQIDTFSFITPETKNIIIRSENIFLDNVRKSALSVLSKIQQAQETEDILQEIPIYLDFQQTRVYIEAFLDVILLQNIELVHTLLTVEYKEKLKNITKENTSSDDSSNSENEGDALIYFVFITHVYKASSKLMGLNDAKEHSLEISDYSSFQEWKRHRTIYVSSNKSPPMEHISEDLHKKSFGSGSSAYFYLVRIALAVLSGKKMSKVMNSSLMETTLNILEDSSITSPSWWHSESNSFWESLEKSRNDIFYSIRNKKMLIQDASITKKGKEKELTRAPKTVIVPTRRIQLIPT